MLLIVILDSKEDSIEDSDEGNGGRWFSCSCGSDEKDTSTTALITGWGIIGLCWCDGYYLVRRIGRRS